MDFPDRQCVQERNDRAVGQVKPHQSMPQGVSVHGHHVFKHNEQGTPLNLQDTNNTKSTTVVVIDRGNDRLEDFQQLLA